MYKYIIYTCIYIYIYTYYTQNKLCMLNPDRIGHVLVADKWGQH